VGAARPARRRVLRDNLSRRVTETATPPRDRGPGRPDVPVAGYRRRRALALVAAGLLVLVVVLLLRSCGGDSPPAEGAAKLVPARVLGWVHVSTDRGRDGVQRALDLAKRFPSYGRVQDRLLARLAGGAQPVRYDRDLAPWLGREVGLALLDTSGQTAGTLIVAAVADRGKADAYLRRAGQSSTAAYRGVTIRRFGTVASTITRGFLLIGQESVLRGVIDASHGQGKTLAADPTYRRAMRGLPAGRAADAFVTPGGVRRLLEPQGGALGVAGVLLDQPALAGAGVALTAQGGRARVTVHSVRDPRLARGRPTTFGAFAPSLAGAVPKHAMAYVGVSGLDKAARRILSISAATGAAGARIQQLLRTRARDFSQRTGVNIERDVLPLFRGEVALWLGSSVPSPYLTVIARTNDEARTRAALGKLQAPLVQLFLPQTAQPGQAPTFAERDIGGGVQAFSLDLAPGVQINYAVFGGKLVISTNLEGVRAVRRAQGSLTENGSYQATLGSRPKRVTSLVFLDFSQLLGLGERTGLNASRSYLAARSDLRRIRALGASTSGGGTESTTELRLQIS
jgi:hypothetical protein